MPNGVAMMENSCAFSGMKGTGICFYLLLLWVATCFMPNVQGFSDEWLRPKWMWFGWVGAAVLGVAGMRLLASAKYGDGKGNDPLLPPRLGRWFCEAFVLVAFWEAVYAIGKAFRTGWDVAVSGTFDNPAGLAFCLCASLPFYYCLARQHPACRSWRFVCWVSMAVVIAAILLSQSRTGWVCVYGAGYAKQALHGGADECCPLIQVREVLWT